MHAPGTIMALFNVPNSPCRRSQRAKPLIQAGYIPTSQVTAPCLGISYITASLYRIRPFVPPVYFSFKALVATNLRQGLRLDPSEIRVQAHLAGHLRLMAARHTHEDVLQRVDVL